MFWANEEKEPEERKAKQKISVTVKKKSLRKEFDIINENWKEKGNHNGKH